jgi:YD repeat-containing protein
VQQLDGRDIASGGSPDVRRSDGLDRVVEVEERNGAETYTTRYAGTRGATWKSVVDALGNVKRYRFRLPCRLLEIDDPDRGLWRSTFDDVGNLSERTDCARAGRVFPL